MPDNPRFFVPAVPAERQESFYSQWAEKCGIPVLNLEDRIYSITWVHNSTDRWIVTVGECLIGKRTVVEGRGRNRREYAIPIDDPARVLAIYPGAVYTVITDGGLSEGGRTGWANPFYAGNPSRVEYFSR